jgi:hypothetical protein
MGRHDEQAVANPKIVDAFAKFVEGRARAQDLLQRAVGRDQEMLGWMRGAGA